ncbi:hypothetical protein MTO96_029507 [Rhipicephalus appendiculatus]
MRMLEKDAPDCDVDEVPPARIAEEIARHQITPDESRLSRNWKRKACKDGRGIPRPLQDFVWKKNWDVLPTRQRLHKFGIVPSPRCPNRRADETLAHALLECSAAKPIVRPIALGRTIAKLYAGCLTTRLQRWLGDHAVLSRCQKGFLPHDGVFEYNFVLQGRLDDARTGGGELCVGFLDYANAFGSVAHQALVDAVRGAGAGQAFTAIVEERYRANTTCAVAAAGTTEPINIGAGLRQGCPLSGLLFNMSWIRSPERCREALGSTSLPTPMI